MPGRKPPYRRKKPVTIAYEPRRLDEEAQLQEGIEADLDRLGWLHYHDHDSRKNNAALPDIVAIHPTTGTLLLWELKSAHGRLSQPTIITHSYVNGERKALKRPRLRRGQTEWRAAALITMRRAPGVVDYRVVRPQTYKHALAFLLAEHERAGGQTPSIPGRLL